MDTVCAGSAAPGQKLPSPAGAAKKASRGRPRGAGYYERLKVGIEWAGALVLSVAAAPLIACLAILLKCTSDGPAFYSQMRLGRSGELFRLYKLRTMRHGCEAVTGPVWSIADDPRVTRVGRWLRDTHMDELPQLWNVLRGEMSLIGPRPERPEIAAQLERWLPEFRDRLKVRPGITGLAQMQLPADSDLHTVRRKLAHDLHYIEHLGPSLDLRISLSTVLYFAGAACRAASRQLLRPFTPTRLPEAPATLPRLGWSLIDHPVGSIAPPTAAHEFSRAA
jgi:lipopolysaccharide/colanic/teichoic acid biosynthesis glycosyltransferase